MQILLESFFVIPFHPCFVFSALKWAVNLLPSWCLRDTSSVKATIAHWCIILSTLQILHMDCQLFTSASYKSSSRSNSTFVADLALCVTGFGVWSPGLLSHAAVTGLQWYLTLLMCGCFLCGFAHPWLILVFLHACICLSFQYWVLHAILRSKDSWPSCLLGLSLSHATSHTPCCSSSLGSHEPMELIFLAVS